MLARAFRSTRTYYWIIQGAGLAWLLGSFLVLSYYGVEDLIAGVDSSVFSLVFVGMVTVLDRIFTFYNPKSGKILILLALPLALSFLLIFIHKLTMAWIFVDYLDYVDFLKQNLYLRWAILALAGVMISLIAMLVSRLEEQEQSQDRELHMLELSKEAELSQLRQQLQPHFLFNSLNSISALVVSQPEKAREMVLLLSDFLRGTIRKDLKSWTTLSEELEYLEMYFQIEKVRFGHRLKVEFDISDDSRELQIPQLLIQPLLENAIKHGLYGVRGDVQIRVQARVESPYLLVKLQNPYDSEVPQQKGLGFGLSSVKRRLFLLFGRNDLLSTLSEENIFTVTLKIPQPK
jgi:Putative regulator of cell autolysis